MQILFDPDFDLGSWPGPRAHADAVAGAAWLGPQGFLAFLETELGLDLPHASMADRTAALVPRIFREDRFFGASGKAAPWATAQRLLEWRDHLWEYGWRGEGLGQRRLGELAEVTLDLHPGRAERLEAVAGWLGSRAPDVEAVRLLVGRGSFPPAWRSVLEALERRGTRVVEERLSAAPATGNLAAVRDPTASVAPLDPGLQLVRPHGPREAARDLAEALSADPGLDDTVFIGPDGVLDEALGEVSLPTLGASSAHAASALAALLPLTLELAWSPIDPRLALEWLTLPDLPLPRGLARRLAETLEAWPAVGNPRWCQVADEAGQGDGGAEVRAALETLFVLIAGRDRAIRVRDLLPRIDRIARWAELRVATSAAHAEVCRQACSLRQRFQLAELHWLTLPQLDAVIASVVGDGRAAPRTPCAGYSAVGLPGGVAGPSGRVIWWNFLDGGSQRRSRVLLRAAERSALESIGVKAPSLGDEVNAAAARSRRPLDQAARQLILVAPRHDESGQPTHPHPLWDDIVSMLRDPRDARHLIAERPRFSGVPRRTTIAVTPTEEPRRLRRATVGVVARPAESPTSLAKLLGCSFAYTVEYVGHLRPRGASRVAADGQLHGRLAHEVLATIARSGALAQAGAEREALGALERMLPTHAAELLLPGHDHDLVLVRESLGYATALLGRVMREEGLRVHAAERELSADLGDRTLRGTPDLVLEDAAGRLVLLDFKWSGEAFHRDALRAGTALQLSAYARLLLGEGREVRALGYVILRSRRLFVRGSPIALAQQVSSELLDATWTAAERGWSERAIELARGDIYAEGIEAPDHPPVQRAVILEGRLVMEPPCRYCALDLLCGRDDGAR